ncbi:ABC transporter permease [Streptomyces sp. NPDC021354]|uniref:ABC transporter permease n=1 Tax=Streptomyces sp. NPDC021354 TaxID=3154793 RepID=UPI0033E7C052
MTRRKAHHGDPARPVRLAPSDVLRLGLLGIRVRRMRAALSALGISIGILTLVLVTGIPASSQRALNEQLAALGTNLLRAQPQPNQRPPVLLPPEAAKMAARIGPVRRTSAVANTHTIVRRSDRTDPNDGLGLSVLASQNDLLPTVNGRVRSGRFLSPSTDRLPTVVLGHQAAARLGIPRIAGHPTVVYVRADEDAMEAVADVLPATVYPQLPGLVQVSRPSDEIGLRRALGANRRQIRGQFMTESVVLSLLGGVAGTVMGTLATVAYVTYQGWPPVIPMTAIAMGTGGATAIGVLAGVYPSVRAARLAPTEALSTA